MNRPIKFRAFNKKNKRMLVVNIIDIRDNSIAHVETIDGERVNGIDLVLIQYIGSKDKRREEVYVDSLVEDIYGNVWRVEVNNLEDGVVLTNDFKKEVSTDYEDGVFCLRECKVIGNVWENPELLKGAK